MRGGKCLMLRCLSRIRIGSMLSLEVGDATPRTPRNGRFAKGGDTV